MERLIADKFDFATGDPDKAVGMTNDGAVECETGIGIGAGTGLGITTELVKRGELVMGGKGPAPELVGLGGTTTPEYFPEGVLLAEIRSDDICLLLLPRLTPLLLPISVNGRGRHVSMVSSMLSHSRAEKNETGAGDGRRACFGGFAWQ